MKTILLSAAIAIAALDSTARAGTLYVFDSTTPNHSVDAFSVPRGQQSGSFSVPGSAPVVLAVNAAGDVFVALEFSLEEYSPTGRDLGSYTGNNVSEAFGVGFDAAGHLYVSSYQPGFENGEIEKFGPPGSNGVVIATYTALSRGLAVGPSGNIYVETTAGNIHEYGPTGTDLGVFATLANGYANFGSGLAFDSLGDLYAPTGGVSSGSYGALEEFSPTGTEIRTLGSHLNSSDLGVAVDSNNDVYVVNGTSVEEYNSSGTDLGTFASGFTAPDGLAFEPSISVPEPGSLSLLALSGLAMLGRRRRVCPPCA